MVNYFLVVGRLDLLRLVLGSPVMVPRAVYDPDDHEVDDEGAVSELERGLRLHRRRAVDDESPPQVRERSIKALPHFETLPSLVSDGHLAVTDLTTEELATYAQLRDRAFVSQYGLLAGLGRGEAAALALAESRLLRLATDDGDCIRVAMARAPAVQFVRIRGLLSRAVDRRLIKLAEAREVHMAMVQAGFWDRGSL